MNNLPDCPAKENCKYGRFYPDGFVSCNYRRRTDEGLFRCSGYKEKELVTLDKLPEPDIELFPDHDYGRQQS